jgi:uncharacterized protein
VAAEATSDSAGFLGLADWRRRVAELYADIRNSSDPLRAWERWREVREQLFLTHPQSPLLPDQRDDAHAPRYFPYDPAMRALAEVEEAASEPGALPVSAPGEINAKKIGVARFTVNGQSRALSIYWLQEYSGGLFVSFRDSTSGTETYGAGRYVLDTAKGADLGMSDGRLILDFNFSYPPSCSYDPKWSCPLPPRENWLDIPIRAGERN